MNPKTISEHHLYLLFVLLVVACFPFVSPTNLCSTSGLCCKHRDSECVAQRVYPNHTVDTSQLPCYCDHACIELEDCCPDYKQFCGVKDCHVSQWGPWSPCSVEKCDEFGVEERHRVVLGHPVNGGLKCPHLLQSKQCQALPCERKPDAGSNNMESWRQHQHHQKPENIKTMFDNNHGDEQHNNVVQSQQEKRQQKQSNQRKRMGKHEEDNKNELSKNKQKPFNKHYHGKQKRPKNKKTQQERQNLRQLWKEPTTYDEKFVSQRQVEVERKEGSLDGASPPQLSRKSKILAVKKRRDGKRSKSQVDKAIEGTDLDTGGCMEMVIIRASSACHAHDKRLHLGTRICVDCSSTSHRQSSSHKKTASYHDKSADKSSCSAALTEMPIRKFRINHTCHGKLTFLTKNLSTKCNCRKGLHYELV